MSINVNLAEIITALTLASILGSFLVALFRITRRFTSIERGSQYRQDDVAMIFTCLRVLLETELGLHNGESKDVIKRTLSDLNEYMHTRAAGLSTRKARP